MRSSPPFPTLTPKMGQIQKVTPAAQMIPYRMSISAKFPPEQTIVEQEADLAFF